MRYIDVHCHLDGDCYGSMDDLFSRLADAGVEKVIAAGYDLATSELSAALADKYPACYFTAGFHPTELSKYHEGDLDRIADLSRHPKCVAIGEIGLDYHYPDTTDKPLEKEMFIRQMELASSLGMPIQIHSRDCAEDMLTILQEHRDLLSNGVLMHCYSHSPETAAILEKMGLYFSFGGTSTYSGSKKPRRSLKALRMDRLMTETDSPYLSPASQHGIFPNTPLNIPEIAANMAALKEVSLETMTETVWANAHRLFPKLNN
ncbi:MAG: TatD family hydrolase [Clostridia bacterium]|nr:TatD family hydrolase [Clostridia bacterium]